MAGKSKHTFNFGKSIVLKDAFATMGEELPKLKPALAGSRASMLVMVNGKEISILKGMDTVVHDGDELVLVPVLHGG
jgi:molybdopterin converting factor small subunit